MQHTLTIGKLSFFYTRVGIQMKIEAGITKTQNRDAELKGYYGGVADPRLGPEDRDDLCETCQCTKELCPGHFGHIEVC